MSESAVFTSCKLKPGTQFAEVKLAMLLLLIIISIIRPSAKQIWSKQRNLFFTKQGAPY